MRYRLAIFFVALAAGCGGGKGGAADMTMAPMTPPDLAPPVGMLCMDARADNWQLPIVKTSKNGAFTVTLVASAANPPIVGDITNWTLQIADATTGAMISAATMTVKPWMPDHGHGTSIAAQVMPTGTAGQYSITPLYLFMSGYWTVTFTITNGSVTDSVVYSLCITDGT